MSNAAVLHKILHIKRQEKSDAQKNKQVATEQFEQVATILYQELRMKEKAETDFEKAMDSSMTITKMKQQSLYIHRVNEKIMQLQHQVHIARKQLQYKQAILTDAYIEVKKIEKLIELREDEQKFIEKKLESQMMDDISIRQLANDNIN